MPAVLSRITPIAFALLFATVLSAQPRNRQAPARLPSVAELLWKGTPLRGGNHYDYVHALTYLDSFSQADLPDSLYTAFHWQMTTLCQSMGMPRAAVRHNALAETRNAPSAAWVPTEADARLLQHAGLGEAAPPILEKSRHTRLLLVSEAHYRSEHRLFLYGLLDSLKAQGYTHLACEALSASGAMQAQVLYSSGSYVEDPAMANLLRHARAIGLKLVAYDCLHNMDCSDPQTRENAATGQLSAMLDEHPENKLIVYCGYAHASKVPTQLGTRLAGLLAAHYRDQFVPVTVAQHLIMDGPDGATGTYLYAQLAKKKAFRSAQIVLTAGGAPYTAEGAFDFVVVQPKYQSATLEGFAVANLEYYRLASPQYRKAFLLQLFPKNELRSREDIDQVTPAFQQLADPKLLLDALLPPGNYIEVVRDRNNRVLRRTEIVLQSHKETALVP